MDIKYVPNNRRRRHAVQRSFLMMLVMILALQSCRGAPPETIKGPVLGIDLGTTYSVVGVWREGQVEIIPNEMGNRITPSVVAFTPSGRLVGDGARNQLSANPTNTISAIKRLVGMRLSDPAVAADLKRLEYSVISGRSDEPLVSVLEHNKQREYSTEEISGMILAKMRAISEAYLGENVTNAVVTVPAYFTDAQRKATKTAGTIAGLNVIRIMNEPTAAAIAYGVGNEDSSTSGRVMESNVLVFDLGGGTFDVSVLQMDDGFFEVLSTNGDTHLGGEDFDTRIVTHFVDLIQKKYGYSITKNPTAISRLRSACETAKRQLSSQPEASLEIDNLLPNFDFSEKITRAKFEALNLDLFKKTLDTVKSALIDADMAPSDITEVVLVGGSTRIPKVRQILEDYFGRPSDAKVNVDEAVAYGAAMQGAVMSGADVNVIVADVVPLSLGIETAGGVMSKIIPRNTPRPASGSQTFTTTRDGQTSVAVQIFEGERALTQHCNLLGKFELNGIAPVYRGIPQVVVSFEVDENGILMVSARDTASSSITELQIQNDNERLTEEHIERAVREAEEAAAEDRLIQKRIEARNVLDNTAYSLRTQLHDDDKLGRLEDEDKTFLVDYVTETLSWLEERFETGSEEDFREALQKLQKVANPLIASLYAKSGQDTDEL